MKENYTLSYDQYMSISMKFSIDLEMKSQKIYQYIETFIRDNS